MRAGPKLRPRTLELNELRARLEDFENPAQPCDLKRRPPELVPMRDISNDVWDEFSLD